MPVTSLRQLALRTATKNVDNIEYVPEVPYECIRSLLRNVKTAAQLRKIEDTSPHIVGHDADIWKALIKRDADVDIINIPEPKDPAKWWKVHRKLLHERDARFEKAAAALKEAMSKHEADKESCSTSTLSRTAVSLPKRHSGWARTDHSKPAAGSTFLSRAREQTREKALMRKNHNPLKSKPNGASTSLGKVAYALTGLSDKLFKPTRGPPIAQKLTQPPTSLPPRSQSHSTTTTASTPRRAAPVALVGKRKLAPASNVFGPAKKRC